MQRVVFGHDHICHIKNEEAIGIHPLTSFIDEILALWRRAARFVHAIQKRCRCNRIANSILLPTVDSNQRMAIDQTRDRDRSISVQINLAARALGQNSTVDTHVAQSVERHSASGCATHTQ